VSFLLFLSPLEHRFFTLFLRTEATVFEVSGRPFVSSIGKDCLRSHPHSNFSSLGAFPISHCVSDPLSVTDFDPLYL